MTNILRIGRRALPATLILATLVGGCREVVVPDYNAPSTDGLVKTPTAATVNSTTVGLLVGIRGSVGTWATGLGVLGREVLNLDTAEPRNVNAYLIGPLEPGGFGVDQGWTATYRNLRTAVTLLDAIELVPDYTPEQKSAVRGFVKTIMAQDYVNLLRVRDTFGIVLDVNADPTVMGDFVSREDGYARAATLFDEGRADLLAGGGAFPFPMTSGFSGFDTPATFVKVNRALKARMEVYRERWQDALNALDESFISTASTSPEALANGAYHVYSTTSGDAVNPLYDAGPRWQAVEPSFLVDAQSQPNGEMDRRASSKAEVMSTSLSTQGVSSNVRVTLYESNVAPVPWIKNEELILLRAEAYNGLGNRPAAIADLNFVRVNSGGLAPLPADYSGDLVDEILYNRRYSLFYEYGHRWVDSRRYGRLNTLPKALPTHRVFPLVPIPIDECSQREPEPKGCVNVLGF